MIKQKLNEGFELPPDINIQAEKLAKFIASLFLKYFKTRITNTKTKSDNSIVKYNEYYRLAKQYRSEGKTLFGVMKEDELTTWGKSSMRIYPKNTKDFPDVILKITGGYEYSNGGYVESIELPQEIFILVDTYHFVKSFKKSTEELIDTVKHEIRHWYQFNYDVGLPKKKVLNKKADVLGYRDIHGKVARELHHMRDAEFKTNLYTYAFHIKRFLNRNFPRTQWEGKFKEIATGKPLYTGNENLDRELRNIEHMMKKDKQRWRLFIKELYKLIFNT